MTCLRSPALAAMRLAVLLLAVHSHAFLTPLPRLGRSQRLKLKASTAEPMTSSTDPVLMPLIPVEKLIEKGIGNDFAKVYSDETIALGVDSMNRKKKGSVLVYDRNDDVVGIFTERDFVKSLSSNIPAKDTIGSIMTPVDRLIVGRFEWSIRKCQETMVRGDIYVVYIADIFIGDESRSTSTHN